MKHRKQFELASEMNSRNATAAESKTHISPQSAARMTKNNTDSTRKNSVKSDDAMAQSQSNTKSHAKSASKPNPKESNKDPLNQIIDFAKQGTQNWLHANEFVGHVIQCNFYTLGVYIPLNLMKTGLSLPTMVFVDNPSCNQQKQGADSTKKQNVKSKLTLNSVLQSRLSKDAQLSCSELALKTLQNSAKPMHLDEICAKVIELGSLTGDSDLIYKLVANVIHDDITARGVNSKFEKVANSRFQIRNSRHIKVKLKQPLKPASRPLYKIGTIKDAIVWVLRQVNKPMHYKEICQRIIKDKLYKFQAVNPSISVLAIITRDINTYGEQSLIQQVKPGWYKIQGNQSIKLDPNNQTNDTNQVRKLNLYELAIKVLKEAGKPLSGEEITNRIIKSGLYPFNTSAPKKSVVGKICSHIRAKGDKSEIVRLAKGIYTLRNSENTKQKKKIRKSKTVKKQKTKTSKVVTTLYE